MLKPDQFAPEPKKAVAVKWGPAEWYGLNVASLSTEERLCVAQDALKSHDEANRLCPHLSALTGQPYGCSKAGGVCTVQRYTSDSMGVRPTGQSVAICPARLVTREVLRSIAKTVLDLDENVVLVKEVPYSLNMTKVKKGGGATSAGRIDWLLVDANDPKRFAAVETQAVYMSGKSQDGTFNAFVEANGEMAMPPAYRHPDYKSSVPKRLAPQLESKARHLSSTSRKTVVIVDEFVLSNMSKLAEVPVPLAYASDPVRAQRHKLEGCEVVFVIVSLENGGLEIKKTLFTSINAAKEALDAVARMSQPEFEQVVASLLHPKDKNGNLKPPRADKVFRLS